MHKIARLVFTIILFTFSSIAQEKSNLIKKLRIGLKTSVNYAYLERFGPYEEDLPEFNNFFRMRGGSSLFISYQITPLIRLETGFGYSNYGGQFRMEAGTEFVPASRSTNNTSSTTTYYYRDVYRMDFLEIPVELKIFILPKKQISPYLTLGLSYGTLLRATNKYNFNNIASMQQDDITAYVNKNMFNTILGAGVEVLRHKNLSIGSEISVRNSITKAFKYDKLDYAFQDEEDSNYEYVYTYNMDTYYHNIFFSLFTSLNF